MGDALEQGEDGTVVRVWVVPGARRSTIRGLHGEAVKVSVAAPPEAGKANKAMLRLLSDRTGTRCELLRGHMSREKHVLVRGQEVQDVAVALGISAIAEDEQESQ